MSLATALMLVGLAVGLIGGFVLGWIAHRDNIRGYLAGRERHWQRQIDVALDERDAALDELNQYRTFVQQQPQSQQSPSVINVHVHPSLPQGWSQPVIDGQVVSEPSWSAIESGVA